MLISRHERICVSEYPEGTALTYLMEVKSLPGCVSVICASCPILWKQVT
jgi:hypothetical protein